MRESTIQAASIRIAKEKGWRAWKWVSPNRKGVPDVIFIKGPPLQLIFVEFKAHGERPTPIQRYVHGLLRGCGAQVEVVSNTDEARRVFS